MKINGLLDSLTTHQAPPNAFTRRMGSLIRQARFEANLPAEELADALCLSTRQVNAIENGQREVLTSELIVISRALCKPLLFFIPEPHRHTVEIDALTSDEFDLLMMFSRLPECDRAKVLASLRGLTQWMKENESIQY
jgi:transcriptional regulator with XRE-family HTH domain